ncbi:MAG: glycosyl transferase family 1 [Planctomyces sp.]|nr:glycosyl transferase family 1 [Planctomyces sp.]
MTSSTNLTETDSLTGTAPGEEQLPERGRAPSRFKIAQVVEATNAGVGRCVMDLVDGLLNEPVDVHLVYSPLRMSNEFRDRVAEFERRGASVFECPINAKVNAREDFVSVRRLRKYLKQQGPFDIVHGHSSKGGAIARLAARGLKTVVVYTPNAISTLDPRISKKANFVYGTFERILDKFTTCQVAVSEDEADHFVELGLAPDKIRTIPNCMNTYALPTREEVRLAYDLPLDKRVLGFVGRLEPQKGPEVMIKAYARIAEQFPDVILAMIGGGELEPQLRQLTRDANLIDRVYFLGPQPGNWSMPGFDIFCMTSRYEGFPYVALEAAYAGLPIVSTRFQKRNLMLSEGENGYLVDIDDDAAMAEALTKLLADPEKIAEFGRTSAEKFREFSAEGMVSKYMALFQSLLQR